MEETIKVSDGIWEGYAEITVNGTKHIGVGVRGTKKVIALCGITGANDEPESIGNALLISAAPDLLEACEEALRVVDEAYAATGFVKIAKTSEQRLKIEAAIAKASGEVSR